MKASVLLETQAVLPLYLLLNTFMKMFLFQWSYHYLYMQHVQISWCQNISRANMLITHNADLITDLSWTLAFPVTKKRG